MLLWNENSSYLVSTFVVCSQLGYDWYKEGYVKEYFLNFSFNVILDKPHIWEICK